MDLGIVSTRYAKALLLFAEQNNEEDRVYEETLLPVARMLPHSRSAGLPRSLFIKCEPNSCTKWH